MTDDREFQITIPVPSDYGITAGDIGRALDDAALEVGAKVSMVAYREDGVLRDSVGDVLYDAAANDMLLLDCTFTVPPTLIEKWEALEAAKRERRRRPIDTYPAEIAQGVVQRLHAGV